MKTIIFMVFLTTIQPRIYIVMFCKIVSLTSSMLFCFYTFLTAHCLPWIGGGVVMVLFKYEKMMICFCAKRQFSWGDQGNGIYSFLCCFRRIFTFPPNWRQLWSLILFASMQGNKATTTTCKAEPFFLNVSSRNDCPMLMPSQLCLITTSLRSNY